MSQPHLAADVDDRISWRTEEYFTIIPLLLINIKLHSGFNRFVEYVR